jgi:hypothetical protein
VERLPARFVSCLDDGRLSRDTTHDEPRASWLRSAPVAQPLTNVCLQKTTWRCPSTRSQLMFGAGTLLTVRRGFVPDGWSHIVASVGSAAWMTGAEVGAGVVGLEVRMRWLSAE